MKKYTVLPIYFLFIALISCYLVASTLPFTQRAIEQGWWMMVIPLVGVTVLAVLIPFVWTGVLWYRLAVSGKK